jgi:carbamoyltransferase
MNAVDSPHMLRSFTVKPQWRNSLAAVVHVDGTTRPQTVGKRGGGRYRAMIEHFAELTGIPAVLNTSFNDEKEPIVCTPADAMRIFATTKLDALAIGRHIVRK